MRSQRAQEAISILGLIAALAIAVGLDSLTIFLSNPLTVMNAPPAGFATLVYIVVWTHALTPLVLAAALLLLSWFVLTRVPRIPWIAVLYLLVGLYLALSQVPPVMPALTNWWPPFFYGVMMNSRSAYTVLSGSFIAITGLLILILRRR